MDDPGGEASPEAAWLAGQAAGLAGEEAANPHPPGSDLALDWAGGWREGEHLRTILSSEEGLEAWRKLG